MIPFVTDKFLPEDTYKHLCETIPHMSFVYGSKSNANTDPHGHWSWKPVYDQRKNLADITHELRAYPELRNLSMAITNHLSVQNGGGEWCLIRCYANAHTYGVDGYFHCDSDRPDEVTAVLYICKEWDRDWAGETVIVRDQIVDGSAFMAVLPAPNRLLVIPSDAMHCARAVSRKCTGLRTTMVFKLRPRRDGVFEQLSEWLVSIGALTLKHQQHSSLHDHLMRCYTLLREHGNDSVMVAGGLHSIYGTNAFPQRLLDPNVSNRAMVAGKFGEHAEGLAFLFSVLDRPRTLDSPGSGGASGEHVKHRLKLTYDRQMDVDYPMLRDLQLIECANLADQGALDKWPNLKKLWTGK